MYTTTDRLQLPHNKILWFCSHKRPLATRFMNILSGTYRSFQTAHGNPLASYTGLQPQLCHKGEYLWAKLIPSSVVEYYPCSQASTTRDTSKINLGTRDYREVPGNKEAFGIPKIIYQEWSESSEYHPLRPGSRFQSFGASRYICRSLDQIHCIVQLSPTYLSQPHHIHPPKEPSFSSFPCYSTGATKTFIAAAIIITCFNLQMCRNLK